MPMTFRRWSWRQPIACTAAAAVAGLALWGIGDPLHARAAALAGACLVLWLGEAVPPFVPTFLLLAAVPLVLPGDGYRVETVLRWMADPVLVLFLAGMVLGVAAQRHGIDVWISGKALRWSGGHRLRLLALVMAVTTALSMWMSNAAATVVMLTAMGPVIAALAPGDRFRTALLVAIAIAANLGGLATPIASPPNAIAMEALEGRYALTLAGWMGFGLPCAALFVAVGYLLLVVRYRLLADQDRVAAASPAGATATGGGAKLVACVSMAMVAGWIGEPWLGVPIAVVAALGLAVIFAGGLLPAGDLSRVDWATLALIAGGIALGRMLQETGCVNAFAASVDWQALSSPLRLALLVAGAALLSSVTSNTATATIAIPLALAIDPWPWTPVLVALGCSLGMPFAISTPANALVYARGLRSGDLLLPGLVFIVLGCALTALLALLLPSPGG
jgi:sodium-dependent dicarboxylate transporter 2/3/5